MGDGFIYLAASGCTTDGSTRSNSATAAATTICAQAEITCGAGASRGSAHGYRVHCATTGISRATEGISRATTGITKTNLSAGKMPLRRDPAQVFVPEMVYKTLFLNLVQ